jgi:hypothetical protein
MQRKGIGQALIREYVQRLIFDGPSPKGEVAYHLGFNAS